MPTKFDLAMAEFPNGKFLGDDQLDKLQRTAKLLEPLLRTMEGKPQ